MPLILNNRKIAGVGDPGKSAYDLAKESGYAGTSQEYGVLLSNVAEVENKVPLTRTINGKTLTEDITLNAEDVNATPTEHASNVNNPHETTAAQVGALPITGGLLTGNTIGILSGAGRLQASANAAWIRSSPNGTSSNYRAINIYNPDYLSDDANAITLTRVKDGSSATYKLYGEHNKPSAADITSGTLPVARGGTGATTFASGQVLIGNGTGAVTTRAITNNTTTSNAITGSTNLVTMNTLSNALGRTTGIGSHDTNYNKFMMRGIAAGTTDMTAGSSSLASGTIYLVYE